jgi:phenylpyruvate tautomerase PptA (4-oxalocrotonate tautomerase family)
MPTYLCYTAANRLSQTQKAKIADAITAAHSEEMAGPRYLVQVVFQDFGPAQIFIGGQPVSDRQIFVNGDVRVGRSDEKRQALEARIAREVVRIADISLDDMWVYVNELSPVDMVEFGHTLPLPGREDEWLQTLPKSLRERLTRLEATRSAE